jgi:fibronectin type 3 domain-containing protein
VAPYTRYYYKVIAYNSQTESHLSSSDFGLLLSVPTGVSASRGNSNSIKITWDLVSFSSGYKIYRATSLGDPYSLIYTGYPTTFYDYDVTQGAYYYYKVTAYNGSSESAYSSYDSGYAGTLITSSFATEVDANDVTDSEGCTAMTTVPTIVSTDNLATTQFDTVSVDYSVSYLISNSQANLDGYTAKIAGLLEIYNFNAYTWTDVAAFDVDITNSSGTLTGSLTSHPYGDAFFAEKMRLHIQYGCIGQTSASEAFSNELNISQKL